MNIPTLQKEINALRETTAELEKSEVEMRLRLDNGNKSFSAAHDRIAKIEERITPKPPSVYKIIGITITVVLAGAGGLWGLANTLRDRPTSEQIERIMDKHDDAGHKSIREDVGEIQREQGIQRALIEGVDREQKKQGIKLDTLLDRIPKKRGKR